MVVRTQVFCLINDDCAIQKKWPAQRLQERAGEEVQLLFHVSIVRNHVVGARIVSIPTDLDE